MYVSSDANALIFSKYFYPSSPSSLQLLSKWMLNWRRAHSWLPGHWLMAKNNGRSYAHHHCWKSTRKVGSMVFLHWCTVLDEVLQELEDAIRETMDCEELHPERQKCRVGYLSRRIDYNKIKELQYVDHTAVVIELLRDSEEQKQRKICKVMELCYLHCEKISSLHKRCPKMHVRGIHVYPRNANFLVA